MKIKKYLEIFTREAEEHLQVLRQGILALEREGFAPEKGHQLLRSAHTLKGSARLLDLKELEQVAHRLEDLFKELEEGQRSLTPSLTDLMLVATDALEALIAQVHSGGEVKVNVQAVLEGLATGTLPEAPPSPAAEVSAGGRGFGESVRTSVAKLDRLVNLMGETLIARHMLEERNREAGRLMAHMEGFLRRLRRAENYQLLKGIIDEFTRFSLALERDALSLSYLTEEMHHEAMGLRMLPLATITEDLVRAVRNLAREQQKQVEFSISGQDVELDRMMLEALRPMLLHMLRNSVDHGIETPEERRQAGKKEQGAIRIEARYERGGVRIVLHDDGRGIDPAEVRRVAVEKGLADEAEVAALNDEEAVYLILRPGFSTRQFITDVSGRGVGMDVVKVNIDQVKGNLIIQSEKGRGTEMILDLPLTLALVSAVLVDCEGETYAVPLHYVAEIIRLTTKDLFSEGGREVIRVRDRTLPLFGLAEVLGLPATAGTAGRNRLTALVLRFRGQSMACLVSRSLGVQDLVVKGMGQQLKSVRFFSGATILGDGSPSLILSIPDLFCAGVEAPGGRLRREFEEARKEAGRGRVLVVDDSITTRTMERNILETHGYEVDVAVSGQEALEKVDRRAFDLVVTDIEMPGMDGFELTRRLRELENYREVPVIIVSSRASDEDRRRGMEVGAQAYIVKGSFDQGTLLDTVETLIG